jgi:L-fucose isomerase-like protein
MEKQTFGVIVSTRSFFPPHLVSEARAAITKKLNAMGYGYVMVKESETKYGAVLTFDEAKTCAGLFRKNAEIISGIIVILPNFGEETGVAEAIDLAKLNVPVLIQACDDDFGKLDMANRRDAFCGKISLCNNLYQRNIKFTDTTYHTCSIDSEEFTGDIERFAGVCRVVGGLKGARIAMLGARPLAFNTVRFSEKILQKYGMSVQATDLSEVIFKAKNLSDGARIKDKIAEIKAYGGIPSYIGDEKIEKQARFCLAVEEYVDALQCDASTLQCWSSLEENFGCAGCLAMSMMGDKGKPSACEADVTGAVSMLAAQLAAQSAPALMDWNNNLREDRNCCISFHCSNFPKSFMKTAGIEIECLDILSTVYSKDICFGAIKGQVAEGDMTFVRFSTDDAKGALKAYVGEGEFRSEAIPTKGGVANCYVDGLQTLLKYICKNGFEHHVCFVRGKVADMLEEALGNYMGIEVYRHRA